MSQLSPSELLALLRLQQLPHVGDINAKKLIAKCGSASAIFEERKATLHKIEGVGTAITATLWNTEYAERAEQEYAYMAAHNVAYCGFMEASYPRYLKHCIDAPILLFKRGKMDVSQRKTISIVGTRRMTAYGAAFIQEFISAIAPLDPLIVSGFAYGVDIAAQRAAMDHGLQTIGCLAHGLNQLYPMAHSKYVSKVEGNGGFLTEFWSSSNPLRENFLRRNRVIAGMSEATIVVESAERGGSLVTAEIANGYNRDVFAVPGRTSDKFSTGCNNLIKQQKAHVLTSAADLVYMLGWKLEDKKEMAVQKQLFVELDEMEQRIYGYLQNNGKQLLDTVALECNLPIFKASSLLLGMEMKGVIRPLPGKLFEAI